MVRGGPPGYGAPEDVHRIARLVLLREMEPPFCPKQTMRRTLKVKWVYETEPLVSSRKF